MPRGVYPRKHNRSVAHDKAMPAASVDHTTQAHSGQAAETADNTKAMSHKTERLVDDIRKSFRSYVSEYNVLAVSRAELAPKFMKAFRQWRDETKGSFIGFVRLLDPSVPEAFEEYKANRVYAAADYLRRLVAEQEREQREPVPENERPVSPLVALARLVATVLPSVDPSGTIWNAFVREMHWSPQQAERVKVLGAKQGPIRLRGRQASGLKLAASA